MSLCHFNMPMNTIGGLIEERRIDRVDANKCAKRDTAALPLPPEDALFIQAVKERVQGMTDNDLRQHSDHVPQALKRGMDMKHHFFDEAKKILVSKYSSPDIAIRQLHQLINPSSGVDMFGDDALGNDAVLGDDLSSDEDHRPSLQFYRQSYGTEVIMTTDGKLPLSQVKHNIAAMEVYGTNKTKWIMYDQWINREDTGDGFVNMCCLIAGGEVKEVVVKSHERIPSHQMPLLSALCKLHNTVLVVAKQKGKSLDDMAEIELLRKEALRTSNEDFEDAVQSIKKSWSSATIEIHDKLRNLYSYALGYNHKGNQKGKKYKSEWKVSGLTYLPSSDSRCTPRLDSVDEYRAV